MLTRRSFIKKGLALLAVSASSSLFTVSEFASPGEKIELRTKTQAKQLAIAMYRTREKIAADIFNNAFVALR